MVFDDASAFESSPAMEADAGEAGSGGRADALGEGSDARDQLDLAHAARALDGYS